ncbi:MAG: helix-turn-helix domain-containing protein [Aureispira sp.]
MRPNIIIDQGIALYIGQSQQTTNHKHYAIQISIVLKGLYTLHVAAQCLECTGIYINSNVEHKHNSLNGIHLSIFLDAETDIGQELSNTFSSDFHLFDPSPILVKKFISQLTQQKKFLSVVEGFLYSLFNLSPIERKIDDRILQTMEKITSTPIQNLRFEELLADIPLSISRIRHLFKAQVGISIQRYLLWVKVKKAFVQLTKGESLSQAAYTAGFADQAHMSRTIKDMFGLSPKQLLKDSHYVQDF